MKDDQPISFSEFKFIVLKYDTIKSSKNIIEIELIPGWNIKKVDRILAGESPRNPSAGVCITQEMLFIHIGRHLVEIEPQSPKATEVGQLH